MNGQSLKAAAARFALGVRRHAPEILTGLGIAGMLTTTVLAVRATPEAMRRIERKKKDEGHRKLTTAQTVQAAWTCYIPAAVTGTVGAGCLIGASSINGRRNAALATAYTLAESTLRDYRRHVTKTLGETKEAQVREAADRESVRKNPPKDETVAENPKGLVLCYDRTFGRYFYSNQNKLQQAANELNRRMATMTEPYVSLNDFYLEIGVETTEIGELLGWNVNSGLIELEFSSQLANGQTPCLVVSYATAPNYDYY